MISDQLSLSQWLDLLENRHSDEIQLGLDRIKTVAHQMDLLHFNAQVITVAGTNGKGSTVAALEAIYLAAGYNVACYTSPNLIHFNERIRVNTKSITDDTLCAAFITIEKARQSIHLTYFEVVTLAALWYFKQLRLDVVILEVGMGGRLDATNIIDSDLAIITTIDFDHQAYLGDTKDAIGYEKAGILRLNKPFIYADSVLPNRVVLQAKLLNAPRIEYSLMTTDDQLQIMPSAQGFLSDATITVQRPRINPKAACAAVIASAFLKPVLPVSLTHWNDAMKRVSVPGRQQLIEGRVSTLFDVAHNPQAVLLLAEFVRDYAKKSKVHAVFSCLSDKDLRGLIQPMNSYVDFWYPAVLSSKRAVSEGALTDAFSAENLLAPFVFRDPTLAYHEAMQRASTGDLIVVFGSFLTVSAIMANYSIKQGAL